MQAGAGGTPHGGEVVVLFDGPATGVRAVHSALGAAPEAAAGLSIAEVAVDGGPVSGPAVEEAVRLGLGAGSGELLVSRTAGVLLASAEVELTELAVLGRRRLTRARFLHLIGTSSPRLASRLAARVPP